MRTHLAVALAAAAALLQRAAAAPEPWKNDTVLSTLADRLYSQQLVVSRADLTNLDGLVKYALGVWVPGNCTFSDIDYSGDNPAFWPAVNHSARARAMATAVISPGSAYHGDASVQAAAYCALSWWLATDPQNPNWVRCPARRASAVDNRRPAFPAPPSSPLLHCPRAPLPALPPSLPPPRPPAPLSGTWTLAGRGTSRPPPSCCGRP